MSHQYVVNLSYKIKYETANPVPLEEIIDALNSLNTLLSSASSVISEISHVEIQGHQLYVEKIESGSLLEDISVALIFGDKEKMDDFLRWLHGTNMRHVLVGVLLGGALVVGYGLLTQNNADPSVNNGTQVTNSPNAMVINFPEGTLDEETRSLVNQEVAKRIKNKNEFAKQTLNFFEPARADNNSYISLGEGTGRAEIPTNTIQSVPKKYTAKKNNRFEDLNGVTVELRATDLDNKKSGWAGSIEGITGRVKVELDPTIDPIEIYGKTKVLANITLERDFKQQANQMVPKRIIIRSLL